MIESINLYLEQLFIAYKTKKNNYNLQESEFEKCTKSTFQSITDLIKQRDKLKANIVHSNSNTNVKIGNYTMTVADAIERKKTIEYTKKNLLNVLRLQRNNVTRDVEAYREKVQNKIDENIRNIFSRDVKPDATTIKPISDSFWASDPVEVYDPLKVDSLIENLENEISDFTSNVDFALSESNSLTQIEC